MDANSAQLLFFGVIIAVIIGLMFRNGRKRQRDAATMASSLRPGAEIMTASGIFGTVTAIDDEENKITLRTGPTSELTVHRQAIGRVVTPVADDDTEPGASGPAVATAVDDESAGTRLNGEAVALDAAAAVPAADPAYGEREAGAEPTTEDAARRTGGGASKTLGD